MKNDRKDSVKDTLSPTETSIQSRKSRSNDTADDGANDVEAIPYPTWHSAVAGGIAGFGSRLGTAPLDLIRIRRQLNSAPVYPSESLWASWKHIVATEGGVTALYRGNMAAIYLWIGYAAVQFSAYDATKEWLQSAAAGHTLAVPDESRATTTAFLAGACAGVCATIVTYPFDVCRTAFSARGLVTSPEQPILHTEQRVAVRSKPTTPLPFSSLYEPHGFQIKNGSPSHLPSFLQSPSISHPQSTTTTPISNTPADTPPKTLKDFARQMFRQKGIAGFYAGSRPAVIQIIPYMGLNFALYDWLTTPRQHSSEWTSQSSHTILSAAYAGSISGAISKICVYPLDTVKRRLQAQAFYTPPMGHVTYKGMLDCIAHVYRHEGMRSFYRGVVPSVIKTGIASSLTFALFRWTKNTLGAIHDVQRSKQHPTHDGTCSSSRDDNSKHF